MSIIETVEELDSQKLLNKPSYFAKKLLGVEPFEYQKDFIDADNRKKVCRAGRQVGKSRCVAWIALHKALMEPPADVIITAEAQRQARELINQIKSELSESPIEHSQWGIDRGVQMTIEFDQGSRIIALPTGRSGEKIRSYTADMLIVDEAAFVDDDIYYDALEPMTLTTDGDIVLTSTPLGKSGFFYEKDQHPEWHRTHVPSSASPLISDAKFEEMKSGRTQRQIQQELLGEFVSSESTFFPTELLKSCSKTNIRRQSPTSYLSVDPAGTGADRAVLLSIDDAGNVFDVEVVNPDSEQPLTDIIDFAEAKHEVNDYEEIRIDQTGMGQGPVEMLRSRLGRRLVSGVKLKTKNKQDLYQSLKAELEAGSVTIPATEEFIRELDNIGYSQTRTGMYKFHAQSGHDDRADALAIAVSMLGGDTSTSNRGDRATSVDSIGRIGRSDTDDRPGRSRYRFD
jgi:phage FluMu gp28-like protein